jgi:hypothetical protein
MSEKVDVLEALREDEYRWGDLQAIRYDRNRTDLFSEDYLSHLYYWARDSRRRSGNGAIDATFGGTPSSDFGSIVSYLSQRPFLLILGRWEERGFKALGFAFPTVPLGTNNTEKALIAGYCMFRHAWGTEDQQIVTMLGLAYLFKEFDLQAIIGNRHKENALTAKFMAIFGFKECGEIPRFQLKGKKLVPMLVSSLLREDFEQYAAKFLVEKFREEPAEDESPAPESGTFIVQAIDSDDTLLQEKSVERTAEAVAVQIEAFKRTYPDCHCKVKEPEPKPVIEKRLPPPAPAARVIPVEVAPPEPEPAKAPEPPSLSWL